MQNFGQKYAIFSQCFKKKQTINKKFRVYNVKLDEYMEKKDSKVGRKEKMVSWWDEEDYSAEFGVRQVLSERGIIGRRLKGDEQMNSQDLSGRGF